MGKEVDEREIDELFRADTTGDGIGDTMYMVPANQQKVMKMNMATKVTQTNSTSR